MNDRRLIILPGFIFILIALKTLAADWSQGNSASAAQPEGVSSKLSINRVDPK